MGHIGYCLLFCPDKSVVTIIKTTKINIKMYYWLPVGLLIIHIRHAKSKVLTEQNILNSIGRTPELIEKKRFIQMFNYYIHYLRTIVYYNTYPITVYTEKKHTISNIVVTQKGNCTTFFINILFSIGRSLIFIPTGHKKNEPSAACLACPKYRKIFFIVQAVLIIITLRIE